MTQRTAGARSWPSEREVADQLPIECTYDEARWALEAVPFWFHTFALNRAEGLYTPGAARDHGYRLASIPESFSGLSVLDVGAFDGFYSFLAEHRGAKRVVAVDNEQYREWVRARWGVELRGGEGFETIAGMLGSKVEYARLDAFEVPALEEHFDVIFCFGILHRVENPFGLLRTLISCLSPGGRVLIETAGTLDDDGAVEAAIHVARPAEVNARDEFYYWQFSSGSLRNLATYLDATFVTHSTPLVDGQPRIVGQLKGPASRAA